MEGEAREIQLDGVNRQRLFLSNMKTKSTDLREERKKIKGKGKESERAKVKRSPQAVRFCLRLTSSQKDLGVFVSPPAEKTNSRWAPAQ